MDPWDTDTLSMRMNMITTICEWAGDRLDPEIVQVALDAIPIGDEMGYVLVWLPYAEGDYAARWCVGRSGLLWALFRARRQRSIFSFVIDVSQALKECEQPPATLLEAP